MPQLNSDRMRALKSLALNLSSTYHKLDNLKIVLDLSVLSRGLDSFICNAGRYLTRAMLTAIERACGQQDQNQPKVLTFSSSISLERALAIPPPLVNSFCELSLQETKIEDKNLVHFSRFVSAFRSLTHLSLWCDGYSLVNIFRLLLPLDQLAQLGVKCIYSSMSCKAPVNDPDIKLPQLHSVKRLKIIAYTKSHSDLVAVRLPQMLPNVEVVALYHGFGNHGCFDCARQLAREQDIREVDWSGPGAPGPLFETPEAAAAVYNTIRVKERECLRLGRAPLKEFRHLRLLVANLMHSSSFKYGEFTRDEL